MARLDPSRNDTEAKPSPHASAQASELGERDTPGSGTRFERSLNPLIERVKLATQAKSVLSERRNSTEISSKFKALAEQKRMFMSPSNMQIRLVDKIINE